VSVIHKLDVSRSDGDAQNTFSSEGTAHGTIGEIIAELLWHAGVDAAFGVISIHNMPILDAIGRAGKIRFIPSRGEAGGLNMADAYARVRGGLGVAFTSTGTAAGNAAGALVEALTAGSPVLHITGQIETPHLDKGRAYIHEAPQQLEMLKAVSKAAFRIWTPDSAAGIVQKAIRIALSPPMGPVSIEIPIDVQAAMARFPKNVSFDPNPVPPATDDQIEELAQLLRTAKRPMIMLGGGARNANESATRLADAGVGVVTSTNGRAVVRETHPMSLGAFNVGMETQELYDKCDLLIVAGSRLRSNETLNYQLRLPDNTVMIDCDPAANGRSYKNTFFLCGDCCDVLNRLAERIPDQISTDPRFPDEISAARDNMVARLRESVKPYTEMIDTLQHLMPEDAVWLRDVTISNSMWGNRYLRISDPRNGVHAVGGGIGQGIPMATGAARAAGHRTVVALVGDGGVSLSLGELATLVEEKARVIILLMNDSGYGVIRNIQDVQYGKRRYYSDILIPDFNKICAAINLQYTQVTKLSAFPEAFSTALKANGPSMIEVDMTQIGPMHHKFSGPPKKTT